MCSQGTCCQDTWTEVSRALTWILDGNSSKVGSSANKYVVLYSNIRKQNNDNLGKSIWL